MLFLKPIISNSIQLPVMYDETKIMFCLELTGTFDLELVFSSCIKDPLD